MYGQNVESVFLIVIVVDVVCLVVLELEAHPPQIREKLLEDHVEINNKKVKFMAVPYDISLLLSTAGNFLLIATMVFVFLDMLIVALGKYIAKWQLISDLMCIVATGSGTGSFLIFGLAIFTDNYWFQRIIDVTSSTSPLWLKFSAMWTNAQGSLLLWTTLALLSYLSLRLIFFHRAHDPVVWKALIVSALQVFFITFIALASDPFLLVSNPCW